MSITFLPGEFLTVPSFTAFAGRPVTSRWVIEMGTGSVSELFLVVGSQKCIQVVGGETNELYTDYLVLTVGAPDGGRLIVMRLTENTLKRWKAQQPP